MHWANSTQRTAAVTISYANFSLAADKTIKPIKTAGPTHEVTINGLETHITGMKYDILPA